MKNLMRLIYLAMLVALGLNVSFAAERLAACDVLTGIAVSEEQVITVGPRGSVLVANTKQLASEALAPHCSSQTSTGISTVWRSQKLEPTVPWTGLKGSATSLWLLGQQQTLLHSVDFGSSWNVVSHEPDSSFAYMDVLLPSAANMPPNSAAPLYAVGMRGLYSVSTDNGKTWQQQDLYIDPEWDEPEDFNLNGIVRLVDGGLLVAGEAGAVYWSEDGKDWTKDNAGSDATWFGLTLLPNGGALLLGFGGAVAYVDTYKGQWVLLDSGVQSSLFSATVLPSGKLLLGGQHGALLEWDGDVDSAFVPLASGTEASITAMAWQQGKLFLTSDQGYWSLAYP